MRMVVWAVVATALTFLAGLTNLDSNPTGNWWANRLFAGVSAFASAAQTYPKLFGACLLLLLILVWLTTFVGPGSAARDPQRMFTAQQRKDGFDRAGGQCEFTRFVFFRCGRPAEHADHWKPWSRGGASDMQNLVAACAPCNLSKSNKPPTMWQSMMLQRRRRHYFPVGTITAAGSALRPPPRRAQT